jgi:hypothetical protein
MDEQNKPLEEQEEMVEVPDRCRREFVTKLVTAAGAVAAAGLLAGSAGESTAAEAVSLHKSSSGTALWRIGKVRSGFSLTVSGRELGNALRQAGLLDEGANVENAKLTIEFTA